MSAAASARTLTECHKYLIDVGGEGWYIYRDTLLDVAIAGPNTIFQNRKVFIGIRTICAVDIKADIFTFRRVQRPGPEQLSQRSHFRGAPSIRGKIQNQYPIAGAIINVSLCRCRGGKCPYSLH